MEDKFVLEGCFTKFNSFTTLNAISFNVSGAIDFIEQIDISLSNEYKEGYSEESLWKLYHAINNNFTSMSNIFKEKFYKILKKNPTFLEKETKVYYKCERLFKHSHSNYNDKPIVSKMSLNKALYNINKLKLDLV